MEEFPALLSIKSVEFINKKLFPVCTHLPFSPAFPLGGNASDEKKLKPLLAYRGENPGPLKNGTKSSLPVVWKSHRKA
jgi:hypothetical protein